MGCVIRPRRGLIWRSERLIGLQPRLGHARVAVGRPMTAFRTDSQGGTRGLCTHGVRKWHHPAAPELRAADRSAPGHAAGPSEGPCHNAEMDTVKAGSGAAGPRSTVAGVRTAAFGLAIPGSVMAGAAAITILGAVLLFLLTPIYLHPALDLAGSATILGLERDTVWRLSDQTVSEILVGPGSFALPITAGGERFYDEAEAGHLRDVRLVLYAFLALWVAGVATMVAALGWARDRVILWRAVGRGALVLAGLLTVLGAFSLIAFETAFELFHRVFFPGGNYAFDPGSQRLVQLYPIAFWQLTSAVLGVAAIAAALAVVFGARRRRQVAEAAALGTSAALAAQAKP